MVYESHQVRVGRRIGEGVTALRLAVAGATDAAEAGDGSCALNMHRLVLGVSAHPRDHDLVLVSEDQVHTPVSIEAPLAHVVIATRLGAHARTAGLATAVSKLLNDPLEALLGLSAQRLDSRLTATRDADFELRRHGRAAEVEAVWPLRALRCRRREHPAVPRALQAARALADRPPHVAALRNAARPWRRYAACPDVP